MSDSKLDKQYSVAVNLLAVMAGASLFLIIGIAMEGWSIYVRNEPLSGSAISITGFVRGIFFLLLLTAPISATLSHHYQRLGGNFVSVLQWILVSMISALAGSVLVIGFTSVLTSSGFDFIVLVLVLVTMISMPATTVTWLFVRKRTNQLTNSFQIGWRHVATALTIGIYLPMAVMILSSLISD